MTQHTTEQPTESHDVAPGLVESVWRYRWLVATATLAVALLGYAASHLQPTAYQGEARILLADPRAAGPFGESGLVFGDGARYVRNQAQFAGSTPVMLQASELLDGAIPPNELRQRTQVVPSEELDLITIRVRAPSAQLAADAANAVGEAYQQVRSQEIQAKASERVVELERDRLDVQQRLDATTAQLEATPDDPAVGAERDALASELITIDNRIRQISTEASLYGSGVELFEEASPPQFRVQPRPRRNAAVAALLALLAASAAAWWLAGRKAVADDPSDPAPVLGAPLLGKIPDFGHLGHGGTSVIGGPYSHAREAYEFVLAALEPIQRQQGAHSILITSAGVDEGKTLTALNLAIAAARDGRSVLLVDADERARGLTQVANVAPEPGLTDLGDPDVPVEGCIADWTVSDDLVVPFMPAGAELSDPAAVFRSVSFRRGVQRLGNIADLVLVDTPPVLVVSDTAAIASQFDGIVIVVERGTPMKVLDELRQRLDLIGMPVLGYVFNRAADRSPDYRYGYGYPRPSGNGFGHGANGKQRQGRRGLTSALRRAP